MVAGITLALMYIYHALWRVVLEINAERYSPRLIVLE